MKRPRLPSSAIRLSVCSYSKTSGYGEVNAPSMVAHQPQQAVPSSTVGDQRGDKHLCVDHYLVHGLLPAYRDERSGLEIESRNL